MPINLRGRLLFNPTAQHSTIAARIEAGASFAKVTVSDDTDPERLETRHGDDVIPLFTLSGSGELRVITVDDAVRPRVGQSFIAMVGPSRDTD